MQNFLIRLILDDNMMINRLHVVLLATVRLLQSHLWHARCVLDVVGLCHTPHLSKEQQNHAMDEAAKGWWKKNSLAVYFHSSQSLFFENGVQKEKFCWLGPLFFSIFKDCFFFWTVIGTKQKCWFFFSITLYSLRCCSSTVLTIYFRRCAVFTTVPNIMDLPGTEL